MKIRLDMFCTIPACSGQTDTDGVIAYTALAQRRAVKKPSKLRRTVASHSRTLYRRYTGLFNMTDGTWRRFWTTVCKTVRPMLSGRCPVCL